MQTIVIAGRLGRDAELREAGGTSVCSFTVAVDYRDGRDKKTNWWRVSLWGKRGEALSQYLTKGTSVTVSGEFSLSEYDGKPQLNIRANDVTMHGGRSEGGQERQERQSSGGSDWGQKPAGNAGFAEDLSDDIPFVTNNSIY